MSEKSLVLSDNAMSVEQVVAHRQMVVQVMSKAMTDGQHYGKVPGCGDKPTLLLPGAQTLCNMFQLFPEYVITERSLRDGAHREYEVRCTLSVRKVIDDVVVSVPVSQGVGLCSSLETKYLMRNAAKEVELTEHRIPSTYWKLKENNPEQAKEMLAKAFDEPVDGNLGAKKNESGEWVIAIYRGGEGKVENPNPADTFNTVLKIAKKRAYVDATITATASSDLFTQDLEDIQENMAQSGATPPRPVSEANQATPEQVRQVATENWQEVEIHFGKNKGQKLGSLKPNQLEWYATKWEGGTSKKDAQLKAAVAIGFAKIGGKMPKDSVQSLAEALEAKGIDLEAFAKFADREGWSPCGGYFDQMTEEEAAKILKDVDTAVDVFQKGSK
jgi:hypothetical protein